MPARFAAPRLEDELILLCSRVRPDEQTVERIRSIASSQVYWEYVYELAQRHAVLPLVYFQLNATSASDVPVIWMTRLKKTYQDNLARNVYLTAELVRVLRLFAAAGIDAVPYKGPALALLAYGNIGLRRFVDLDILVRKTDVLRAAEILEAQGYACDVPWTRAQQAVLLRTQHNLPLSRESGRLIIELHWEVASEMFASSLQFEDFVGRLDTMRLNGVAVKTLAIEDLLLSLCVHGSKHLWERLAWICDVAELSKTEIDWPTLLERSCSTGNERMLLLGLYLSNLLLDFPLPAEVKARLSTDRNVATLGDKLVERLFSASQAPATFGESIKFNWAIRSGWKSRMNYCRLLMRPTDADVRTFALPRALSFVYYVVRPIGLLKRDWQRRSLAKIQAT